MTNQRRDLVSTLMVAFGACLLLAGPADAQRGHRRERQAGAESPATGDTLTPTEDGQTVYDSRLKVTWLADANYAHSRSYGVQGISPSGAMNYAAAVAWVNALNKANYLGHRDWTLPASPQTDSTCAETGPQGNGFSFGCHNSALGSLYYDGLGLHDPETAVQRPPSSENGFKNFQNNFYWSASLSGHVGKKPGVNKQGYAGFSFAAGYKGSNIAPNDLYAIAMISGPQREGAFPPGSTVYDPVNKITWLADANLARTLNFGVNTNADGAMTQAAAVQWVANMNSQHYLGHTDWELPTIPVDDPTCSVTRAVPTYGYGCTGGPMGQLYYGLLHKTAGESVLAPSLVATGPFRNLQPYFYWSCMGPTGVSDQDEPRGGGRRRRQESPGFSGGNLAGGGAQDACGLAPGSADFLQFCFSFSEGFQNTEVLDDDFYVMVYYPGPPPGLGASGKAPPGGGVKCAYGKTCSNPTM
jgi:hypothetical protein